MWDLPGPGIKPVSPAFQGGFLTLDHQGNLQILFLFLRLFKQFFWCEPLLKSLLNSLGLPRWCSGEKSHLPMQETQETWVWSLGWKDPLELEMATCSRICAWKIQWTEEPDGLQFMRLQRVGQDWLTENIEFVTILLLLFMFCFVWPWSMWYLSSLTRTLIRAPCIGRQYLNHWTAREIPPKFLIIILLLKVCINIVENREKKCY